MHDNAYKLLMKFTWDENKRQANLNKHQLDFADAEKVFLQPTDTIEDNRFDYGEQRWYTLGILDITVIVIAHTETEDEIHVISMRKAEKNEQAMYFRNR
jgi:uncharacterized DUF497 family protein